MICIQPSWISSHPSRRRFTPDLVKSQSLTSLAYVPASNTEQQAEPVLSRAQAREISSADLKTIVNLLNLQNNLKSSTLDNLKTKDSACKNGYMIEKKSLKTPSKTIKNMMKWIQKSGKKANQKYITVKNSTNAQKKQEAKPQPQTLSEVLRVKESTQAFRQFLVKELSEENLDFWCEVESYKTQKSKKQEASASAIFQTYIAPGSPKEINIDSLVRKQTKENLQAPNISSFDVAQEQIFKLMECDSFRRYLKTVV